MWIKRFSLTSYFSFENSGWIDLSPNFNVFVGANNAGKTSLLKAFSANLPDAPHRNANRNRKNELVPSEMNLDVEITLKELFQRHSISGVDPRFPAARRDESHQVEINNLLSNENNIVCLEVQRTSSRNYFPRDGSSLSDFRNTADQRSYSIQTDGQVRKIGIQHRDSDNLCNILSSQDETCIFYLEPQRLHVGSVGFRDERTLSPNASNLPNVLLHLQTSRPAIFQQIVSHVSEISQSVKSISATPNDALIEIILWPTEENARSENSFRLNESGTGIGQLISIITAAATNEQCVIVIDEISTFLHPAATKRLISVLKSEYSQHQYIISTHSSDVISCINPDFITMIQRDEYKSTIKKISSKSVEDIRTVSSELGFSMMDVFAHDRMIWVEGETELIAFPYLLRKFGKSIPGGVGFSTVASASDFDADKRSAKSIIEMYQHVVRSIAPLIQGLAFGLDRESNSDDAVQKLEKSKRKLRFLPRRCFECYLLEPEAISSVLSHVDGNSFTAEQVRNFLIDNGNDLKYRARSTWNGDIANNDWLKKVDAAKLLSDCFSVLTENRTEFRKTRDSIEILKIVAETHPGSLDELNSFVSLLVEIAQRDTRP